MKQTNSFFHSVYHGFYSIHKAFENGYQKFSFFAESHPFSTCALLSLFLNLLLEMLGRRSPLKGISYLFAHPYLFFLNALIIFMTLSLSFLFARRTFALTLISICWLVLGVANCVILGMRNTPLAAIDFGLAVSCFNIIFIYLSIFELLLIIVAFIVVLLLLIRLFRITKRLSAPVFSRFRGVFSFLLCGGVFAGILFGSIYFHALETKFADLPSAYQDYGFAYCFSLSVIDRGIDRPDGYSDTEIDAILSSIDTAQPSEVAPDSIKDTQKDSIQPSTKKPNVIFVQLESFFDVNRLSGITFSENPVPNFSSLKKQYSSGFLSVPSIGAGTANTEFEILTGMNLEDFGAGEYPYKTVLQTQTAESLAYNLDALGYSAHALHNNTGAFYDRNKAYASLGFDTFTSLEYMQNVTLNPLGWAKDAILTDYIFKCLNSTDHPDFVFAVSVQPHGRYPDDNPEDQPTDAYDTDASETKIAQKIDVYGIPEENLTAQYRYYVNQLYETDAFIGELTSALSQFDEPTVLVLYGDHLPCFNYTSDDLADGSTPFDTEYILWSNFSLEPVHKDLHAYQLSAEVLQRLDIHEGIITRLHQSCANNKNYLSSLKMLEYDMLYGEQKVWGGIYPYLPKILHMGIDDIRITDIKKIDTSLYVTGQNFTPFSRVTINGKQMSTTFIDANTLLVTKADLFEGDRITVAQAEDSAAPLSETNAFYFSY
ncbi:MAG: sulfatase-like hydrolase/transferase [Clostridia bacterium]|nr:sulfatase-like hydrolase/transferase [Clostridia bacterium]